jgi:hypothetical protein
MNATSDISRSTSAPRAGRRQRLFIGIERAAVWLSALGLGWLVPLT